MLAAPATSHATPLLHDGSSALPTLTLFAYALPSLSVGSVKLLFETYLLKFSTDGLLIGPGTMGAIFSICRLWDAISDPVIGYLSDITRTRFGRRRMWMLGAALPLALAFFCTFSPPPSLVCRDSNGRYALVAWMLGSLIFYYTALTAFTMPYMSLGVEITEEVSYNARSSLFGWKSVFEGIGALFGVAMMALLMAREADGPLAVRTTAIWLSGLGGGLMALVIVLTVLLLSEVRRCAQPAVLYPDPQSRLQPTLMPTLTLILQAPYRHIEARRNPFALVRSVLRSDHSQLFTLVLVLHDGCKASFASLAPFAIQ